jgi:hypothetical protein
MHFSDKGPKGKYGSIFAWLSALMEYHGRVH